MDLSTYLKEHSRTDFANSLHVSQGLIYQWEKQIRPISPKKCVEIERVTGGLVTRKDLRDDWEELWPELADDRRLQPDRRTNRRGPK